MLLLSSCSRTKRGCGQYSILHHTYPALHITLYKMRYNGEISHLSTSLYSVGKKGSKMLTVQIPMSRGATARTFIAIQHGTGSNPTFQPIYKGQVSNLLFLVCFWNKPRILCENGTSDDNRLQRNSSIIFTKTMSR